LSRLKLARELALFCLAFLPRLAYLLVFKPPFETTYWALAGSVVRAGSLAIDSVKVTDFEPLYPILLAACRALVGDRVLIVQLLQATVASVGAVFLYRLSLDLTGSARAAWISAALFSFHPLLVRQAAAASDLALVTTLMVIFAYSFVSIRNVRGAAIAGVWLGFAALTRVMALPVAVLGPAILLRQRKPAAACACLATTAALVFPFLLRNHIVNASWLPTRNGINLYIANSPYTGDLLPTYDLDLLVEPAYDVFSRERPEISVSSREYPAAVDAFFRSRAIAYMIESPARTLRQKFLNVMYFLSPRVVPYDVATADTRAVVLASGGVTVENSAPRARAEVWAYAVATSFVLVTAAAGIFIRRRSVLRDEAILWAIVATFVLVNAVYVPASRYTAPMLFALLFYSGVALASAPLIPGFSAVKDAALAAGARVL
jgi:hypothetical protein